MPYLLAGYASIWFLWMPLRFATRNRGRKLLSTVWKVIPTLMAAGLAAWGAFARPGADVASCLLFVGVLIGAGADVGIEYSLSLGGTLFFVAHCLFIAAFVLLCPIGGWFTVVFAVTASLAAVFLSRYWVRFSDRFLRVGVVLYALALCALLGAALPAPFLVGGMRVLIGAIGAALFVLSDATLCRNSVAHRMARAREAAQGGVQRDTEHLRMLEEYWSLGCYYTAQVAFAVCAGMVD